MSNTAQNNPQPSGQDHRSLTSGKPISFSIDRPGGGTSYFRYVPGESDTAVENALPNHHAGFALKSGEVLLHSGSRFHALIVLDTLDNYRIWTIGLIATRPVIDHNRPTVLWHHSTILSSLPSTPSSRPNNTAIANTPELIGPYRYRYYDAVTAKRDPKIGIDDWSAAWYPPNHTQLLEQNPAASILLPTNHDRAAEEITDLIDLVELYANTNYKPLPPGQHPNAEEEILLTAAKARGALDTLTTLSSRPLLTPPTNLPPPSQPPAKTNPPSPD